MERNWSWVDNYWRKCDGSIYYSLLDKYLLFRYMYICWKTFLREINIFIYFQKLLERRNYYHRSFVCSLEFNPHETIRVWLGTANPKRVFFNNASSFQSICYSTHVEMTRFTLHIMSSHVEYKCIFIWVLNWCLFGCSLTDITTCTEIGILESSDEAISIWMEVSFGQCWRLPGILLVQKVKMKLEASTTRCRMQASPCVSSSYSTS